MLIIDPAAGQVTPQVTLDGVQAGQLEHRTADGTPSYELLRPGLAWDLARDRLFVAHSNGEEVTVVDLAAATSRTVIIAQTTSLLGQLGEWLIPSARAKMAPETAQRAVLSDDGRHLYITGRRLIWIQRADGSYTEEVAFSGLRVIATDELRELARHDLPVDHVAVAPDGQTLLLTGIAIHEGKPVGQGLFLLDAFEPRRHMQLAPKALVTLHGFSHDGRVGYVVLERDGEGVLQAIDLVSDQVIAERGLPWGNAGALLTVE